MKICPVPPRCLIANCPHYGEHQCNEQGKRSGCPECVPTRDETVSKMEMVRGGACQ